MPLEMNCSKSKYTKTLQKQVIQPNSQDKIQKMAQANMYYQQINISPLVQQWTAYNAASN